MIRLFFIVFFAGFLGIAQAQENHSKANLVFDHKGFGQSLKVGLYLELEEGWYTYGEHPGEIGKPPSLDIHSSIPVEISNMFFPKTVQISDDVTGYKNETLVYREIKSAAANLPTSIHLDISAQWLVCKDTCVPCSKEFSVDLPIQENPIQDESFFSNFQFEGSPPAIKSSQHPLHFFWILFMAFLGGALLNLMPCVLPVVSLKLLSVMKSSQEKKNEIRKSNLIYTAGILVSLFVFALIFLVFHKTSQSLGWGFQLQSPAFITFLILLFFIIGLNLIGLFEIQSIPVPGLGKLLQPKGWASDFFAGFFTTIVATPCTAPFMAVAIGYALTQNNWTIIATFMFLGLGLGSPYLMLSAFPKLIKWIPKPGAWMVTLKEFLAFPMFLSVAWLTWLLVQHTSNIAVISSLTALSLVVFFFWSQKVFFKKNLLLKKIFLMIIALVILFTVRIPFIKTDNNINWKQFDVQKIEDLSKDSIVFIDFTADWCLTCKVNERNTFENKDVIKTIKKLDIQMIKADWTKQNPEITAMLKKFDRAGVPFYLLYKPSLTTPLILPTLLTPGIFIDEVTKK